VPALHKHVGRKGMASRIGLGMIYSINAQPEGAVRRSSWAGGVAIADGLRPFAERRPRTEVIGQWRREKDLT
jgi:hypothetical protein